MYIHRFLGQKYTPRVHCYLKKMSIDIRPEHFVISNPAVADAILHVCRPTALSAAMRFERHYPVTALEYIPDPLQLFLGCSPRPIMVT